MPWAIAHGSFWLAVHAALGLLLVLVSLGLIAHAVLARNRGWIAVSLAGWIGITAAGFNGASILIFGHGFSSMLMSVGFAVAAGACSAGLLLPR
ncbi:MAG TPA: hypothetical protein VFN57_12630 [Thermomicrobiaceae bacterium]|nr:hypothetical protein [Thermomicrobiaceae bacterium]